MNMLRIALCDDTAEELNRIMKFIKEYKAKSDIEIVYDCFSGGAELLSKIKTGVFYDLIFLDVVMPVINGIDTAKEIYSKNKATKIIFLTVSPEFALDSYSVSALDYIIKPINCESFDRAMQKFRNVYIEKESEKIIIQEKSKIMQIALNTLCYVEVYDHDLIYHLSNGDTVTCRQSLAEIENILNKNKGFVKTHRSYIVNMQYVQEIEANCVTMTNGDKIPVSRKNNILISDLFLKCRLEEEGR